MTLLLVVALPLATAVLQTLLGRRLGRRSAGAILVGGLVLAFGASVAIAQAFAAGKTSLVAELGPWLPLRGADFTLRVDPPMVPLLVVLTAVAALIALSSMASLTEEEDAARFGTAFALAVAAVLLVIVASDLLLLFAGWELLAVAVYLLVAHRRDRPAAAVAGLRTFVAARIGDAALLLAILSLLAAFGTVDIGEIAQRVAGFGDQAEAVTRLGNVLFAPSLLILVAALTRSAQLPFHVWLHDTREAPIAATALVQSSAVAVGVVLLLRLAPILYPSALASAAAIGALTAVVGAIVALAQTHPRRLLVWSTVSQLGLMFIGAGAGAAFAAVFQLLAHSLSKATLVLGGDVRARPVRTSALAFGTIALAAVPPMAGYFSVAALAASVSDRPLLLAAALGVVVLTGAYAARFFILATRPSAQAIGEATPIALAPVVILAAGTLVFGGLVAVGAVSLGVASPPDVAQLLGPVCAILALVGAASGVALTLRPVQVALPAWLADAARSVFEFAGRYPHSLVDGFNTLARVLDLGGEYVVQWAGALLGALVLRTSALVSGAHRRYARASEAVVLAAVLALVVYWSFR